MKNPKEKSPIQKQFLKLAIFILIISAPVILVMVVFTPFAAREVDNTVLEDYRLPEDFVQEDVISVIKTMKKSDEFVYYFYALDEDQVARATVDIIRTLDEHRDKESLRQVIEKLQDEVQSFSPLFTLLDIPEEYFTDPSDYPQINDLMWSFIYEEFKLAALGACYKATYDEDFVFQWLEEDIVAARKLQAVMGKLKRGGR